MELNLFKNENLIFKRFWKIFRELITVKVKRSKYVKTQNSKQP